MADTKANLKDAFSGESQANRAYLAYAYKAEEEGHLLVAKRFRVAAASETIHALNHFNVMGAVRSTAENLRASIKGENDEHTSMYPDYIKQAEEEGRAEAAETFAWANEAEKFHEKMFAEALENLDAVPDKKYFVCQWCGMTYENEAPLKCVLCGRPQERIKEVS